MSLRPVLISLVFLLAVEHCFSQSIPPTRAALQQGDFAIPLPLKSVHPRLLFTAKEMNDAIVRYKQNPASFDVFKPLVQKDDVTAEPSAFTEGEIGFKNSDRVARLAVAAVLTGDKTYWDALQRWVPILETYTPVSFTKLGGDNHDLVSGHVLHRLSLTYDVLYGHADPRLLAAVRHALAIQADDTFKALNALGHFPYDQNHFTIPISGLVMAASVLADENPDAVKWGVFASNTLKRTFSFLAPDGWYYESFGYWEFTMQYLVPAATALKSVTGEDLFSQPPLSNQALFLAHMYLPNPEFVFDFGDHGPRVQPDGVNAQKGYDAPWHTLTSHIMLTAPFLLERGRPDALMENYLAMESALTPHQTSANLFRVFWQPPAAPGQGRMKNGPLPYHYFPDMEVVHWRSDWENPDATAIAFKSGPPAGHNEGKMLLKFPETKLGLGHAHPDAGTFTLFAKGVFLANGDTAYVGKKETANTNSILVDGVGQAHGGTPWATFDDRPYATYDLIHMENVWLGSRIAAATAVFPSAYPDALKITGMSRELVLVDGRFLLVRDTIASDASHQYNWLLHGDREFTNPRPNRFLMENGAGRLVIEHLLPIGKFVIGPAMVETELYSATRSRPQQRGFVLDVASAPSQANFKFLAAMNVQSSTDSADDFKATQNADGSVTMSDHGGVCTIWLAGAHDLAGSYAYVLRDAKGAIISAGLSGSALASKDLQIHLKSPGRISIQPAADSSWKIEIPEGAPDPHAQIEPARSR